MVTYNIVGRTRISANQFILRGWYYLTTVIIIIDAPRANPKNYSSWCIRSSSSEEFILRGWYYLTTAHGASHNQASSYD
jgi:hypothetical protein